VRPTRASLLLLRPSERLVRALRRLRVYRLVVVADWAQLEAEAAVAPGGSLAIVDPYHASPSGELESAAHRFLSLFPSVPTLAVMDVLPSQVDDVVRLGKWGLAGVICLDYESSPLALEHRLDSARVNVLRRLLSDALPRTTGVRLRLVIDAAASVAVRGGHVRDIARSLHETERTLLRWCRREANTTPREILGWVRVLLACAMLDDPGRTVLSTAVACGYHSDTTLRRALGRRLGMTPQELRDEGAVRVVVPAMLAAVVPRRDRAPAGKGIGTGV
jgi:AraC-like DNA-binding protein